jgi:hypothetical protein
MADSDLRIPAAESYGADDVTDGLVYELKRTERPTFLLVLGQFANQLADLVLYSFFNRFAVESASAEGLRGTVPQFLPLFAVLPNETYNDRLIESRPLSKHVALKLTRGFRHDEQITQLSCRRAELFIANSVYI